jgi:hypothetical protein
MLLPLVLLNKASPANAHLGHLFEESFCALVDQGFLRFIYGGPQKGSYLCNQRRSKKIFCKGY